MYENGIDVVYDHLVEDDDTGEPHWTEHRRLVLPGWCAGDVQMAVTLHLHGHRSFADNVRVTDWSPRCTDNCACALCHSENTGAWTR